MHPAATWNYEKSPHFLEVVDNPCLYMAFRKEEGSDRTIFWKE